LSGLQCLGLPLPQQPDLETSHSIPTHRVRTKRCACSNRLDSECHYFCHLDIIWVNTPSKTTVYGLGGALSRRRRSTDRCTCSRPDDRSCISFCRLRFLTHALSLSLTKLDKLINTFFVSLGPVAGSQLLTS
uniref:Endothelin-like toxin domain-containing protein n=1 Tax=Salarias fasciatus TaxID=181472 RepID=A0A672GFE6_SALFA